ncbi:MAG: AsmA-like C-terminal region-containing protein [Desulfobacterales bacterium]
MRRPTKYLTAAILIFCLALIIHASSLLLSPFFAKRIESTLSANLDAEVEIKGLEINFFTKANIDSIVISPHGRGSDKQKAIKLSETSIDLSLASLVSGRYLPENILIKNIQINLNKPVLSWLLSLDSGLGFTERLPALEILDGNIKIELPVLKKTLHLNKIKASGPAGKMITAKGKAGFEGQTNQLDFNMNLAAHGAEAEIRADNFDTAFLPAIDIKDRTFNPALLNCCKNLTGKLSVSISPESRTVTFQNGLFDIAGGIIEISSGGLAFDKKGIERVWLRADARRLNSSILEDFNKRLQTNETFAAKIDQGRVNINGLARWSRNSGLDYEADISVRDGSVYFPELKTMVDDIEAEIEASSTGRFKIRNSVGWVSNGKIEAVGFLDLKNTEIKDYRLEFNLSEIAGNDNIHLILPAKVRQVVKDMQVMESQVNGRILLSSQNSNVDLDVKARQTRMPGLPFTVSNPAARIKWNSDSKKIYFNRCQGYINGGSLSGNILLKYNGSPKADFTLHGRRLPINRELLEWLELDSKLWMIRGGYDIELRASNWRSGEKSPSQALKKLQVQADLRNLSIYHHRHGTVANNWYGHLSMDNEGTRLKDFRGEIFGIGFHANGTIPSHDLSDAVFGLESENISLNKGLYRRLPFGEKIEKTDLKGQCELRAELRCLDKNWIPRQGSVSTVIHRLSTENGSIKLNTGGTARMGFSGSDTGDIRVEGKFETNGLSLDRFDANRLYGNFAYYKGGIEVPEMKLNAYGGNIRFADSYINTAKGSWRTNLSLAHMDLESVFAAFGITGENTPAGSLRGQIKFKGKKLNPEALDGGGTIKIARGMLYDFPIFASVFNVLDLQMPRQRPITDAYGNFKIEKGKININDLLLTGGTVPMHMEGSVGLKRDLRFKDQDLDLLATAAKTDGLLDRIPVVNLIKHYTLDLFRRLAMQARIEGTVGNYKIKRLSSPVTKPVEKMWSLMEKLSTPPADK